MMDWTDRHCRYFHRQLSRHARLYTEMVTTGAVLHGDAAALLAFDPTEQPVAVQLGGSEPRELARAARVAVGFGYAEVNLNCGCPSERVQRGAFGACLMREPGLVADCIKAMQDAITVPVTVKHRIGLGRDESYESLRDFVGALYDVGCRVFIVHARNAWLEGLSPKENRTVPPLRYALVAQLKRDFPQAVVVLNGGLDSLEAVATHGRFVDGVMMGRTAYHDPYVLANVDQQVFGVVQPPVARSEVVARMVAYAAQQMGQGVPLRVIARPMLGLFQGCPGARQWRRWLSDAGRLERALPDFLEEAAALVRCDARASRSS